MTAPLIILLALACLLVGAVTGWALATARATSRHAEAAARAEAAATGAQALRDQLERERAVHEQAAERSHADSAAREERERRDQAVLRALAPVQESLRTMQRTVQQLEQERSQQYGSLAEQLRRSHEADEALRATTESLAGALRSNSTRGVWGETQLRRVVEAAGLLHAVDFEVQTAITGEAGAGRPDMVVHLPGGASIAVDAKVPLDAYLQAEAIPETATGEAAAHRRELRAAHVKAVRAHVDALARKGYWSGLESGPEFVICFVPSEALLSAALADDPTLLDHAFAKRVALASPVNLWAVLKTVSYAWTQQDVSQQARELFRLGTEMYSRLGALAGHAEQLRRSIERTVESYNRFAGSLESRVLVSARRFPGIDQTKLDAVDSPGPIETPTRRLSAPELLEGATDDETATPRPPE